MKTILIKIWEVLTTNFWFLPILIVAISIAASYTFIWLDRTTDVSKFPEFYQLYYSSGAEGARAVLSTIASSMMTVTGIVFSITIVALTLASSQFGPRMLRNFMSDRINQVVLGVYVATFIYCLLVLRTVTSDDELTFVPHISVVFAMALSVANIFLLIIYIHHISTSIQADYIIADVAKTLDSHIKKVFPNEESSLPNETLLRNRLAQQEENYPYSDTVLCTKSGYLQAIDRENLVDIAEKKDLIIFLRLTPGDFAVSNQPLVKILSKSVCEDKDKKNITDRFIFGQQRTPTQDPEFAINQLVEVAARALSPGINDPYTAMSCIDQLGARISELTGKKFPPVFIPGTDGNVRIVDRPVNFALLMNGAFNQIRLNGKSHASVLHRMAETFRTIALLAKSEEQEKSIFEHLKMVKRAGDEFLSEPLDRIDLDEKLNEALQQFKHLQLKPSESKFTQ